MARTAADPIRPARAADLPRVLALLSRLELPAAGVADHFEHFVVAGDEAQLHGVAGLEVHGSSGIVRSVAVDPDRRGEGLGRRLAERVIADGRALGLRRLYLLTTTADAYFPRLGFRVIPRAEVAEDARRSVEFAEACPATATVMLLELE